MRNSGINFVSNSHTNTNTDTKEKRRAMRNSGNNFVSNSEDFLRKPSLAKTQGSSWMISKGIIFLSLYFSFLYIFTKICRFTRKIFNIHFKKFRNKKYQKIFSEMLQGEALNLKYFTLNILKYFEFEILKYLQECCKVLRGLQKADRHPARAEKDRVGRICWSSFSEESSSLWWSSS